MIYHDEESYKTFQEEMEKQGFKQIDLELNYVIIDFSMEEQEKPYPIEEKWCIFIKEIEKKDVEELSKRLDVIRMGEKEDVV